MVIPEYRIGEYLAGGGLWNPELANHDAVRDLLIDCRDELSCLRARLETVEAETRERCAKVADEAADECDWTDGVIEARSIAATLRNLEPRHD